MLITQISLTFSHHQFLSAIFLGRSPRLRPISARNDYVSISKWAYICGPTCMNLEEIVDSDGLLIFFYSDQNAFVHHTCMLF